MKRFASCSPDYLPNHYYNIKADLDTLPKPPLHPATGEPIHPDDLKPIFPESFIDQEISMERHIPIPEEVRNAMALYRPTPLIYAAGLKEALDTPAHIFYKYEGASPTGSHKSNTALAQAYLASRDGVPGLVTETGAGQWGSALSHAGAVFDIDIKVYMVRVSFRQKPGRRVLMEAFGGRVLESPSKQTECGRKILAEFPDTPGSLGIAISEAIEEVLAGKGLKYSLGSVLDSVLLHQTVIGQEASAQMKEMGTAPDIVIGCVGGGSNFAGLAFPFIGSGLKNKDLPEFIAVEPEVCSTLTTGKLGYDHGDTMGFTPLLYMHSLGRNFIPPPIHAGGLRYHGMAPLVSHVVNKGYVRPQTYTQDKVFSAARLFLNKEGILPAPESAHAVAAAIDEALKAKESGMEKTILFNLSGHGYLDISAYDNNKVTVRPVPAGGAFC